MLITRRSSQMSQFPHCWVLPGGRLESGESLLQCGIRELREEVGIDLSTIDCSSQLTYKGEMLGEMTPFLAFEECVRSDDGLPISHHLILCYKLKISTLDPFEIALQIKEVDGAVWLSNVDIKRVLSS